MHGAALVAFAVVRFGLRLEVGPAYDSNANRAEVFLNPVSVVPLDSPPPAPVASFLLQSTVGGSLLWNHGANTLRLALTGGGKLFASDAAQPQDVAVVQASVEDALRLGDHALVGVAADYYDAFQFVECPQLVSGGRRVSDPACHRDFRSTAGRAFATLLHGDFDFTVGGGGRAFDWKPDGDLSFDGLFGFASVGAHFRTGPLEAESEWDLSTTGRVESRGYHGPALVAIDDPGGTGAPRRRDTDVLWTVALSRVGEVLTTASYSLDYDRSTSFGQSYLRHVLVFKLACELPGKITATTKVQLIFINYPQSTLASTGMMPTQTIEDENRDAIVVDLERAIGKGVAISARYSLYSSGVAVSALDYERHVVYLGISYRAH